MIVTRTPLRISLVGGGTDVPAFCAENVGAVVSFAINKYVYISINDKFDGKYRISYSKTENVDRVDQIEHPIVGNVLTSLRIDKGVEITSIADIPGEGSGLGSSSSFTVGLINALSNHSFKHDPEPGGLAELAFEQELLSSPSIGKQDHYAASYGGFNLFEFSHRGVKRRSTHVTKSEAEEIESNFVLLWTGITRKADAPLKMQSRSFQTNPNTVAIGRDMAFIAKALHEEIKRKNFNAIGEYLVDNWELKKRLHDGVTNPEIDALYNAGMMNGGAGGKLCGAGGGGFLLFYAHPDTHKSIVRATGLRQVPFKIDFEGSKVIYNGNQH